MDGHQKIERRIRGRLAALYGRDREARVWKELRALVDSYRGRIPSRRPELTQRDVVLITYGDSFRSASEPPLAALHRFLRDQAADLVSILHLLPFFPYSSDDGFSVMDYTAVDPALGTWDHVAALGGDFDLMFDLVINHMSARSRVFREYLEGNPEYRNFFIQVPPGTDLSAVFRPRALPLTTRFETGRGPVQVWTTFSEDQVDLNFANPRVLLYMADVLLFYLSRGASIIRLDAVAYLWKQPGTSCLHLPQTHIVVRLLRDLIEHAAPHARIITETNVPHRENISYFGDGADEAHLVYNFALPPLTAHALLEGDASALSSWAAGLATPSGRTWFYNFTASHDGIGLLPARGLLAPEQVDRLVQTTLQRGGLIG
jgi:sucrose phosphorylase